MMTAVLVMMTMMTVVLVTGDDDDDDDEEDFIPGGRVSLRLSQSVVVFRKRPFNSKRQVGVADDDVGGGSGIDNGGCYGDNDDDGGVGSGIDNGGCYGVWFV